MPKKDLKTHQLQASESDESKFFIVGDDQYVLDAESPASVSMTVMGVGSLSLLPVLRHSPKKGQPEYWERILFIDGINGDKLTLELNSDTPAALLLPNEEPVAVKKTTKKRKN